MSNTRERRDSTVDDRSGGGSTARPYDASGSVAEAPAETPALHGRGLLESDLRESRASRRAALEAARRAHSAEHEAARLRLEVQKLKRQLARSEAELAAVNASNEALSQRLEQDVSQVAWVRGQVSALKGEVDGLRGYVASGARSSAASDAPSRRDGTDESAEGRHVSDKVLLFGTSLDPGASQQGPPALAAALNEAKQQLLAERAAREVAERRADSLAAAAAATAANSGEDAYQREIARLRQLVAAHHSEAEALRRRVAAAESEATAAAARAVQAETERDDAIAATERHAQAAAAIAIERRVAEMDELAAEQAKALTEVVEEGRLIRHSAGEAVRAAVAREAALRSACEQLAERVPGAEVVYDLPSVRSDHGVNRPSSDESEGFTPPSTPVPHLTVKRSPDEREDTGSGSDSDESLARTVPKRAGAQRRSAAGPQGGKTTTTERRQRSPAPHPRTVLAHPGTQRRGLRKPSDPAAPKTDGSDDDSDDSDAILEAAVRREWEKRRAQAASQADRQKTPRRDSVASQSARQRGSSATPTKPDETSRQRPSRSPRSRPRRLRRDSVAGKQLRRAHTQRRMTKELKGGSGDVLSRMSRAQAHLVLEDSSGSDF